MGITNRGTFVIFEKRFVMVDCFSIDLSQFIYDQEMRHSEQSKHKDTQDVHIDNDLYKQSHPK